MWLSRRRFLATCAAAPLAPSFLQTTRKDGPPLFTISLAQWSLHRTLRAGDLNPLDFAKVTRTTYGLDAVEYVNSFFKVKAEDRAYLADMKRRADDHQVKSLLSEFGGRLDEVQPLDAADSTDNRQSGGAGG